MSTAPAVSLRGAALRFGERTLWDGLDLDVAPGEFLAVLGPNGSGKTTLLRVLLGLQPLHAGQVLVGGQSARARQPGHRLRAAAEGARRGPAAARRATSSASASTATASGVGPARAGRQRRERVRRRAGVGGRAALRGRAGRAAVRRRAAAAAGGAGAGRRPVGAAVRRAAALARPRPPAGRRDADRPAAARGEHRRRVRDARDQPGAAARRPRALPRGRALPGRHHRRGDDLGDAVGALPHRRRRAAGARTARRRRGRCAHDGHCHPEERRDRAAVHLHRHRRRCSARASCRARCSPPRCSGWSRACSRR